MRGRWRFGVVIGAVLIVSGAARWALQNDLSADPDHARYLSLRLLPLDEWGFGKDPHAPVPVAVPRTPGTNTAPNPATAGKRFRVTIPRPAARVVSAPLSSPTGEVPVYLRVGTVRMSPTAGAARTPATLNNQFLQNQAQRQTQMLQMVQARIEEQQNVLKSPASSLRSPQKRIIQMEMDMLRTQLATLHQAQAMTLQALAVAQKGPRYIRVTLPPTVIVSENFLKRMATDGEAIRLGPIEIARATRVKVEAMN